MHKSIINLNEIKKEIHSKNLEKNFAVKIIAVTKTFSMDHISHLINDGHIDFGKIKFRKQ